MRSKSSALVKAMMLRHGSPQIACHEGGLTFIRCHSYRNKAKSCLYFGTVGFVFLYIRIQYSSDLHPSSARYIRLAETQWLVQINIPG